MLLKERLIHQYSESTGMFMKTEYMNLLRLSKSQLNMDSIKQEDSVKQAMKFIIAKVLPLNITL